MTKLLLKFPFFLIFSLNIIVEVAQFNNHVFLIIYIYIFKQYFCQVKYDVIFLKVCIVDLASFSELLIKLRKVDAFILAFLFLI